VLAAERRVFSFSSTDFCVANTDAALIRRGLSAFLLLHLDDLVRFRKKTLKCILVRPARGVSYRAAEIVLNSLRGMVSDGWTSLLRVEDWLADVGLSAERTSLEHFSTAINDYASFMQACGITGPVLENALNAELHFGFDLSQEEELPLNDPWFRDSLSRSSIVRARDDQVRTVSQIEIRNGDFVLQVRPGGTLDEVVVQANPALLVEDGGDRGASLTVIGTDRAIRNTRHIAVRHVTWDSLSNTLARDGKASDGSTPLCVIMD
jgi:hypothetical protein